MYGSWMTKLGTVLIGVPPIVDALAPMIPPKFLPVLQAIGAVLALLGIRRGVAKLEKK